MLVFELVSYRQKDAESNGSSPFSTLHGHAMLNTDREETVGGKSSLGNCEMTSE